MDVAAMRRIGAVSPRTASPGLSDGSPDGAMDGRDESRGYSVRVLLSQIGRWAGGEGSPEGVPRVSTITLRWRQRDHADGATGAVDKLERSGDHDCTGGRELVEVAEAGEAEFAGAVHDVVAGEGRVERVRLAGIGPDRLHPRAEHVALVCQQ